MISLNPPDVVEGLPPSPKPRLPGTTSVPQTPGYLVGGLRPSPKPPATWLGTTSVPQTPGYLVGGLRPSPKPPDHLVSASMVQGLEARAKRLSEAPRKRDQPHATARWLDRPIHLASVPRDPW